jgi:DNA-directed RNA polymerase specialized sigma24 family protein
LLLENDVVEQLHQRLTERQQESDDRQLALLACLDALPQRHRDLIEEYYAEQHSVQEMARACQVRHRPVSADGW